MKKFLKYTLILLGLVYISICSYMYIVQEEFIFHPTVISSNEKLNFTFPYEEINIPVKGAVLSGVLCKRPNSNGLVFYIHGNTGSLLDQEESAKFYYNLGYDFFSFDYRGFGKSGGKIQNEKQFYQDVQAAYDKMKELYAEQSIHVVGYSIGTASAAMISAKNNPKNLVLIAPYYSLSEITIRNYKILPTFLLKYKFDTYRFIPKISEQILIVHGEQDMTLPFEGSVQLSGLLKPKDIFLPLKNQGHNGLEKNEAFQQKMKEFLAN